jgi:hypothetical protein
MARRRLRARVNWAARWGGAAAGVAIVLVYIVTSRAALSVDYHGGCDVWIGVCRGQVRLDFKEWTSAPARRSTFAERWDAVSAHMVPVRDIDPAKIRWPIMLSPGFAGQAVAGLRAFHVWVPLWIPLVLAAAMCVLGVRSRRRSRRGTSPCPSCGYDLSGLPASSPCPECAAIPKS